MTPVDYAALAERLKEHAALHDSLAAHSDEQRQWADDLRTVVTMLEERAQEEPVAWMDEFGNAFQLDAWKPAKRAGYLDYHKKAWKPLFTHPAPQPHPDPFPDEPEWEAPVEPTEAQIEAGVAELLRYLDWDCDKHRAAGERIVRAALAAKDKESNDVDQ